MKFFSQIYIQRKKRNENLVYKFHFTYITVVVLMFFLNIITTISSNKKVKTYKKSSILLKRDDNELKNLLNKVSQKQAKEVEIKMEPQFIPTPDNKALEQIKIKYIRFINPDKSYESTFDEKTYNKFFDLVIKPVDEYFKNILKTIPNNHSDNKSFQCGVTINDGDGKNIMIGEDISKYLKEYVSFSFFVI